MAISFERTNEIMRSATRASLSPKPPNGLSKIDRFYWQIKNDFPWYAEKWLKIRNKQSKLVSFELNEAQMMVEAIDKHCKDNKIMRRYIILKARQMGMSTFTEGKIFHETANEQLVRSAIVAHQETASQALFAMSKMYYEELPEPIRPVKKFNNGKVLSFENPTSDEGEKKENPGLRSSIIIATAGSGEILRGHTPTKLHISELAFWDTPEITMLGLLQGVPDTNDSLVILESTANGVGDYFHNIWQGAMKGENDFIPIFLPWFTDSSYYREFESAEIKKTFIEEVNYMHVDQNGNEIRTYEYELLTKNKLMYEQLYWRKWAIRNKCGGDEEKFQQEYPSTPEEAFLATGRPKFNRTALKKYQTLTKEGQKGYLNASDGAVKFEPEEKGYVTKWEDPIPGVHYVVGGDVAEGLAHGDYSCGSVINTQTMDVVAVWHGHIDPDLFGIELIKLARYYNDAYLGVENNNHGLTTLTTIRREEYWNLYFSKSYDRISDKMTQKLGWTTSMRTKPMMIDKLAEFIREMYLGIYSDLIISEAYTYVIEENGKTNAQIGCYDDTIMATAIALQLALEGLGEEFTPEIPFDEVRTNKPSEIMFGLFENKESLDDIYYSI